MCSMFFDLNNKQVQSQKQLQRLIMSPQMQQAIHLMQMPILELSAMMEAELEQNPVLEYDEEMQTEENKEENPEDETPPEQELDFNDKDLEILKRLDEDFKDHFAESENHYTKMSADEEKLKTFMEQSIASQESLFEHLMRQAHETFEREDERAMAEAIIGSFDQSGMLQSPLQEIASLNNFEVSKLEKILSEIQTFDPYGVGGRDLRECLLIQLRSRKLENTLAYQIINKNYDDLIHNRIPNIKKNLKCTVEEIRTAIDTQISHLDLHPGTLYSDKIPQHIIPDALIHQEGEKLEVIINDDQLPTLRLNSRYLKMLNDPSLNKETQDFIKNKLMSAKWLLKNIDQRHDTIFRLLTSLCQHQKKFFMNPDGKITPLIMKTIADELDLHESTIARAVANKYVDTPRGLLPLRYFFSNAYTTADGHDISSKTVRDMLVKIIGEENKKRPLSDEAISKLLEKKGVPCARRTVAKYRSELNIGSTTQRREY